jgi:hypothetical protein
MRVGRKNAATLLKRIASRKPEERKQAYLDLIAEFFTHAEIVRLAAIALERAKRAERA